MIQAQAHNEMLVRACIMHELESYLQNFIDSKESKHNDLYIQVHAQGFDWYTLRVYEKDFDTSVEVCLAKLGFAPSGRIPLQILKDEVNDTDEVEELPF